MREILMAVVQRLRDHLPLEQGLRPRELKQRDVLPGLRDHLPLEQGLRPRLPAEVNLQLLAQRPSAIRTRIKTGTCPVPQRYSQLRDHLPLEQGLRQGAEKGGEESRDSETICH